MYKYIITSPIENVTRESYKKKKNNNNTVYIGPVYYYLTH